jgi:rhodanese-related sulfurtransferase
MRKFVWLLFMLLLLAGSSNLGNANQKMTNAFVVTANSQNPSDDIPRISVDELILMMAKKKGTFVVIDVRVPDSYSEKIRGALQIPYDQIEAHLKDIPRNKEIITYCACPSEQTSGVATKTLLKNGYKRVRALKGGWVAWVQAAGAIEQKQ